MGIDQKNIKFLLSGSSARKLKRGKAKLLGGRAVEIHLHPLTCSEIGKVFNLNNVLNYGSLPKIYSLLYEKKITLAKQHLRSYVTTCLKEEIQAEALTRNLGTFSRFLNIAVQSNAHILEFSNIARECSVPASTVKEYYQILQDTLIGFFLWQYNRNERKKSRPKFYFFDCGVIRAIQNRINDPATPFELVYLFETWFINELKRINDYKSKDHTFYFWRHKDYEIDVLIYKGNKPLLAFECKTGKKIIKQIVVERFRTFFPNLPLYIVSLYDKHQRELDYITILSFTDALELYQKT